MVHRFRSWRIDASVDRIAAVLAGGPTHKVDGLVDCLVVLVGYGTIEVPGAPDRTIIYKEGSQMKRTMFVLGMSALLAAAPAADAKPRMTPQTLTHGAYSSLSGYGCHPAEYWLPYRGRARSVTYYRPAEGDELAGATGYYGGKPWNLHGTVTEVSVRDGGVTWTVAPDPDECARKGEDWRWAVGDRLWAVEFKRKVYAVIGIGQSDYRWRTGRGVVNIAGLPVSKLFAARLNLRTVARYLGRPKRVTGSRYRTDCVAHWPKVGLRAWFVSFGIAPNCWDRQLQSARISGPARRRWAVVEGDQPGVLGATLPPSGSRGPWVYKWWPYGPEETQRSPMITARYGGIPRRITAFNLWIGAAGD
jgi:hypothetical protein